MSERHRPPWECVAQFVEFSPYKNDQGRGNRYVVRFVYDPFLVAFLKKLPKSERTYVVNGKWWTLSPQCAHFMASVICRLGYEVRGIDVGGCGG